MTRGRGVMREYIEDTDDTTSHGSGHSKGAKHAPLFKHKPMKGKLKLTLISFGLIGIICLVMFVYLSTCYVDPNYLNVSAYLNRSYSRDTTRNIIQAKKEYQNALDNVNEVIQSIDKSPSYEGTLKTLTGLSEERFSEANGFCKGYVEINNTIMAMFDEYGTIKVSIGSTEHTVPGINLASQVWSESGGAFADSTTTLIGAFPSKVIPLTAENYKEELTNSNILRVLFGDNSILYTGATGGNWLYGTYWKYDHDKNGNRFYTQQGILTTQSAGVPTSNLLKGETSEHDILFQASREDLLTILTSGVSQAEAESFLDILDNWTWGGLQASESGAVCPYGDRFNTVTAIRISKDTQESALAQFFDRYSTLSIENDYELLCYCRLMHWLPYVDTQESNWNSYYNKKDTWILMAKAVASTEVTNLIKSHVQENLDCIGNNYRMSNDYYSLYPEKLEEIYNTIKSLNITWDNKSLDIDKDFATTQGKYIYIYHLFNYFMLESLYSEGGTTVE